MGIPLLHKFTKRPTVVLVGDDDSFTHGLAEMLQGSGVSVRIAATPKLAMVELESLPRATVLCDLGASNMQAVELVLELHERGFTVPVVAISSMPNIAQHCRALGLHQYLAQPFRLGELLDLLDRATVEPEHVTLAVCSPAALAAAPWV